MGIKSLATKLEASPVEQEKIAREIITKNQEKFDKEFAEKIAKEKMKSIKASFTEFKEGFASLNINGENYIVSVCPRELLKDNRKNKIIQYSRKLNEKLNNLENCNGIIQFLPYLMNSNNIRKTLSKELPIAFVNLHYDSRSLEQKFKHTYI